MIDPQEQETPAEEQSNSQQIKVPASSIQVDQSMMDTPFEFSGMAKVIGQDNDNVTLEISDLDYGQDDGGMDGAMDRAMNAPDEGGDVNNSAAG